MSKNKHKTNIDLMNELMNFSAYGALAQIFILDIVSKKAREIESLPDDAFDNWDNQLISREAWQGVAKEIADKIDAHYRN